jgi:hypothetical protein
VLECEDVLDVFALLLTISSRWAQADAVMHALAVVGDNWEIFANALDPTPPFPTLRPRLQLAGVLLLMSLASLFVRATWIYRGVTFLLGVAFFTDPIIRRGIDLLNRNLPMWRRYLELRT